MKACLIIGILLVIALLFLGSSKTSEKFKVLGTLSPFNEVYYHCLSECERGDPADHLLPTHGSMACQEYCDSVITDLTRRGGPSYPDEYPVAPPQIITTNDEAYMVCGEGTKGDWCRQIYATDKEIDSKCRQDCKYSTEPVAECMALCTKAKSANKLRGWTYK